MKEAKGDVVALDPHRLLTVVLELHRRGRRMKEVEGGAASQRLCWSFDEGGVG
jgi:hypothetical protein